MSASQEIRELESARRNSARAIPVYAGMLVVAAAGLWLMQQFMAVPLVITAIVLGLTAFTLIGDIINYFACGRRLRQLNSEHKGRP